MILLPRLLLAASFLLLQEIKAELAINGLIDPGDIALGDFSPLSCNENIASVTCISWVAQNFNLAIKVEILCGECVTFDEPPGSSIVLDVGFSVVG